MAHAEPDWDAVLSAAAHLQELLPGAVLVGGTAAATYADHRMSFDADHTLTNLSANFDRVLSDLESVAGWKTARIKRPVLILGSLDGVETGVRQLIRVEPLECRTTVVKGHAILLPTVEEMLRIKGILIVKRNATRDYLDFAALSHQMSGDQIDDALAKFESLYQKENGLSVLQQLAAQLAFPQPYDIAETNLSQYKHLKPAWQEWEAIVRQNRMVAGRIADMDMVMPADESVVSQKSDTTDWPCD